MQARRVYFLFFICLAHTLSWIRAVDHDNHTEIWNLFHKTAVHSPESKRESNGVNFSEGGAIDENLTTTVKTDKLPAHLNETFDLLAVGAPETGTSRIIARKGVDISLELPQLLCSNKGNCSTSLVMGNTTISSASPAPVTEDTDSNKSNTTLMPCPFNQTCPPVGHSRKITNTSLPPEASSNLTRNPVTLSSVPMSNVPTPTTLTVPSNQSIYVKHKKPSITTVPADSDSLAKSLAKDRNVVIPVLALIIAPLIVLLALFIYKRVQDSNGTHYMRMGYLIEDIYND